MFFYIIFFILDVRVEVIMEIFLIVVVLATVNYFTTIRDIKPISKKSPDKQNFNWHLFSFLFVTHLFLFVLLARLPSVKMNDGIIRMDGAFGGVFRISDIQSVDTVRFYPQPILRQFGSSFFGIKKGNYKLREEEKQAKLNIKTKNPPYISIRMSDNRLFLFNFKKQNKTEEFYRQLKNELISN